jgi:NTE family protein
MSLRHCRFRTMIVLVFCAFSNVACLFPKTVNEPLTRYEPDRGYRFGNLELGPNNSDETFVCLTLSGGGTRASALAYGVMLGLRDAELRAGRSGSGVPKRTVLDEVDIISSVSGGSFAAVGYGLWRESFFDGLFRRRVLELDLQTVLIELLLNPINAIRLPSVVLDRIDVAAAYYDEQVFDRLAYRDLVNQNQRPFIVVNATNLAISERVEFTQTDFDLLGSDLGSVPVGWAVAASSAFPVVFSPLRFAYHPSPPGSTVLHDYAASENEADVERRLHRWARHVATPQSVGPGGQYMLDRWRHRYLYLSDGGLVDNLGLAHVIESHQRGEIRKRIDSGEIKRLIVITVNAGVKSSQDIEWRHHAPGILFQTLSAASIGVENSTEMLLRVTNHLMTEEPQMHADAAAAIRDACPDAVDDFRRDRPHVERHFIHIGFHLIEDRAKREEFERIPTRLYLPKEQVDALVELGRDRVVSELAKHRLVNR